MHNIFNWYDISLTGLDIKKKYSTKYIINIINFVLFFWIIPVNGLIRAILKFLD